VSVYRLIPSSGPVSSCFHRAGSYHHAPTSAHFSPDKYCTLPPPHPLYGLLPFSKNYLQKKFVKSSSWVTPSPMSSLDWRKIPQPNLARNLRRGPSPSSATTLAHPCPPMFPTFFRSPLHVCRLGQRVFLFLHTSHISGIHRVDQRPRHVARLVDCLFQCDNAHNWLEPYGSIWLPSSSLSPSLFALLLFCSSTSVLVPPP